MKDWPEASGRAWGAAAWTREAARIPTIPTTKNERLLAKRPHSPLTAGPERSLVIGSGSVDKDNKRPSQAAQAPDSKAAQVEP